MNIESIEAVTVTAVFNIFASALFCAVLRRKGPPAAWGLMQVLVLLAVFNAYYACAFWGLFLSSGVLFLDLCKQKGEAKLDDINIVRMKIREIRLVCAGAWGACLIGAMIVITWRRTFSFAPSPGIRDYSLCTNDNCLVFLIPFFLFASFISCLHTLRRDTS
jgi:hypothetical protein